MSKDTSGLLKTSYGEVSYELFRKQGYAFADKSAVIADLEGNDMTNYPVILRPRRFGKSTFVQMLKCFYDISYQDRYEEIFAGKAIYTKNLPSHNTYHVINFDFSIVNTLHFALKIGLLLSSIKILHNVILFHTQLGILAQEVLGFCFVAQLDDQIYDNHLHIH